MCYIVICWFMQKYTYIYWIHTDAMNNRRNDKDRRRKTSLTKYLPLTLLQGFEKVVWSFTVRGSWRSNITAIFWSPLLWPSTLCLSRSLDAQPEALGSTLLDAGFLYWILSASSLDTNSSGPKGPFRLMWLSLPHLVSFRLQLYWNCPCRTQLPTARNSTGNSTRTRTQLSYIMVQRPLNRPLNLWNRMFGRHQAEITVMQFTGHSPPVHQSMWVPWEFFSSSHFISQFPPTRFPLLTAIGMCHFLPVHHLEWHFGPGQKVKI